MSSMPKEIKDPVEAEATTERAGFTRTCSLLSRYLKEKGSLGEVLNLNLNLSSPNPGRSELRNQFPEKIRNLFPESKLSSDSTCMNFNKDVPGKDPKMAPMTIFYAGNVIVLDDFPAERAKEVMMLASRASILGAMVTNPSEPIPPLPATGVVPDGTTGLPIARRASLHRFLEKRRDRLMARVPPYQKTESPDKAQGMARAG